MSLFLSSTAARHHHVPHVPCVFSAGVRGGGPGPTHNQQVQQSGGAHSGECGTQIVGFLFPDIITSPTLTSLNLISSPFLLLAPSPLLFYPFALSNLFSLFLLLCLLSLHLHKSCLTSSPKLTSPLHFSSPPLLSLASLNLHSFIQ